MSRVGTAFLNLGKWLDGENPGSGPQDGTPSDGLNGDKDKIDLAIGTGHNVDGTHKAAVIDGTNIKPTAVDGSTLEQDTTKKLRVKDLGISTAKLSDDAVTKVKLAADVAGPGLKQNTDGSLSPDVDGTTIAVNEGGSLFMVGGRPTDTIQISAPFIGTSTANIPLPIGTITRVAVTNDDGNVAVGTTAHAITIIDTFLRITNGGGVGLIPVIVGGTTIETLSILGTPQFALITMSV
jgi:hypothetical protein